MVEKQRGQANTVYAFVNVNKNSEGQAEKLVHYT